MKRSLWQKGLIAASALLAVFAIAAFLVLRSMAGAGEDPAFFEGAIADFEEADRVSPPAPGGIVFVGSSSIRFWSTLSEDMAPLPVLNRGFGGAHLSHVIHNLDRIVLPYAPRAIVLYAGDNDIGAGKSIERVVGDYQTIVDRMRAALPEVQIYFLPIKPSKARWSLWPEMAEANAQVEALTLIDPAQHYLDTASVLLGSDGSPREDVFILDGLHMNATGYDAWTAIVAPALRRDFPELRR